MTLTQLRYLISLDDYRNFAQAAEHVFVSQPTLSLQIKKLENFIGAALWDRSHTPIVPTPFGVDFILQARKILAQVTQLERLYQKEDPDLEGSLSIGIIPTVASYLYLDLYQIFQKGFPKLRLILHELPTHQILDRLEAGLLDAAIIAGPIQNRHLQEKSLYYEPFSVYLNKSVKYTKSKFILEDIKKLSLLMLSEEHCLRGQTLKMCRHNELKNKDVNLECSSIEIMKKLVEADVASAVLPSLCFPKSENSKQILNFESPEPARVISLVYSKNYYMNRRLDAIENYVKRIVPNPLHQKQNFKIIGIDQDV